MSHSVFHVTVLSNFARGYDKYLRAFRKSGVPESTFAHVVHVLDESELSIGIAKASKLRDKLGIPGDELIALGASIDRERLLPNERTGLGRIWPSPDLPLSNVSTVTPDGRLGAPMSAELASARSLALLAPRFVPYARIAPRSISFLPVARGCQARCPFCFSDASASSDRRTRSSLLGDAARWLSFAASRGAERAVITGGGEPTLAPWSELLELIRRSHDVLQKVVLITNGVVLAQSDDVVEKLVALHDAGLSVLAISRHHPDEDVNARLMKLATETPRLLAALRTSERAPRPRLVCVLQRGGVGSIDAIDRYVRWAAAEGVAEVCFKELYVSTSVESLYHSHDANLFSEAHQVPLSLVLEWASSRGLTATQRLPWGAPIFEGRIDGHPMRVAAYTEPSLFWERTNGIARSWNVMADGSCLASLEDRESHVALEDLAA